MSRPFVHLHRVTFEETNLVGNVYFAHYVRWQGHCREHFLLQEAPGVVALVAKQRLALVTVSCSMNYLSECFAGDEVTIQMHLEQAGSYRISMTFTFLRGDLPVATGAQEVACMNRDPETGTLSVAGPPEELALALGRYGNLEGMQPWS